MWQVNCSYKRNNIDAICLLCEKLEGTTQHVLEYKKVKKFTLGEENSKREWVEITEIYRENKKKREVAVIQVQDQRKIIKESRKKNKARKTKEKEKDKKLKKQKIQKRRTGK